MHACKLVRLSRMGPASVMHACMQASAMRLFRHNIRKQAFRFQIISVQVATCHPRCNNASPFSQCVQTQSALGECKADFGIYLTNLVYTFETRMDEREGERELGEREEHAETHMRLLYIILSKGMAVGIPFSVIPLFWDRARTHSAQSEKLACMQQG